MSKVGAFVRTRVLLAGKLGKGEHHLSHSKWWAKKRPAEGEITMHLSPYEQKAVLPWLKTFPKKVVDRVPTYTWPFGCMAMTWFIVYWCDSTDEAENRHHRF